MINGILNTNDFFSLVVLVNSKKSEIMFDLPKKSPANALYLGVILKDIIFKNETAYRDLESNVKISDSDKRYHVERVHKVFRECQKLGC